MEKFFRSAIRRYYEVELPRNHARRKRWPLLVALHGYEGNKDSMMRVAQHIADGNMVVISLQGPYQFFRRFGRNPKKLSRGLWLGHDLQDGGFHPTSTTGTWKRSSSWPCGNTTPILNGYFLLAFSQACALNYRYVFTHPRAIRGAVTVCGGVPGDWNENPHYRPAATHVLHIAARQDEWYSREKNLEFRRQLGQRAATLDFRFYNSPHKFPRSSIPHIRRWIEKHL